MLTGHATKEEVQQELLDTFFATGSGKGRVSRPTHPPHHDRVSQSCMPHMHVWQCQRHCFPIHLPILPLHEKTKSMEEAIVTLATAAVTCALIPFSGITPCRRHHTSVHKINENCISIRLRVITQYQSPPIFYRSLVHPVPCPCSSGF